MIYAGADLRFRCNGPLPIPGLESPENHCHRLLPPNTIWLVPDALLTALIAAGSGLLSALVTLLIGPRLQYLFNVRTRQSELRMRVAADFSRLSSWLAPTRTVASAPTASTQRRTLSTVSTRS